MGFHEAFSLINEKEEDKYPFGCLFMSFESIIDFTKKTPGLVRLIASIKFSDSFRVKFYI